MTVCENNIYIDCSKEIRERIIHILENNVLFFEAFIPCDNHIKLDFYGTDSDVFIENIILDESEPLCLTVYTHDNPCIPFCNKLAALYCIDIHVLYYNQILNFSGMWRIYRNQLIFNERWNYIQGLYFTNLELFWNTVKDTELNDLYCLSPSEIDLVRQELIIKRIEKMSF